MMPPLGNETHLRFAYSWLGKWKRLYAKRRIISYKRRNFKKATVTSLYGQVLVDYLRSAADYMDCSRQVLRRLEFSLTDERGLTVPLNGHHVSFTIISSSSVQDEQLFSKCNCKRIFDNKL